MRHGKMKFLEEIAALNNDAAALNNYGYMFPKELERFNETAAERPAIIDGLTKLGKVMTDKPSEDSTIDAFLTYFGQFVDHDLTASLIKKEFATSIDNPDFDIVNRNELDQIIRNNRTGINEIDSLYNTSAKDLDGRFILGQLDGEDSPEGNDLPRDPNKVPLIGDLRNDENLAVAQTHVAFLKFHNAIMEKEGISSTDARKVAIQHYQWILIHDFLSQLVDPTYLSQALTFGNRFFKPNEDDFFLPLEFTIAGYRLGHSMIRETYDWSTQFPAATLRQLFDFSSSGRQIPPPEIWKIDWNKFVTNKAKKLDTGIANPLANIPGLDINLAARNLRRGYMFSLPTGQAVAKHVLFNEFLILTPDEILTHSTEEEKTVLLAHDFHKKSPLWYYILKEAEIRNNGNRLGPVGSAIVTEVFLQSIRFADHSILKEKDWEPSLSPEFNFKALLRYTGLLNDIV